MAKSPAAHSAPVLLAWPLCCCPRCSSMDILLEARGSWPAGSDAVCLQHQPSHPHIGSGVKGGSSPSAADGGSKKGGTDRPSQGPGPHHLCPSPPFPYPGIMFKTDMAKVLPARLLRKPEGKSRCSASASHYAVNFSTWLHRSLFR